MGKILIFSIADTNGKIFKKMTKKWETFAVILAQKFLNLQCRGPKTRQIKVFYNRFF